MTRKKQDMKDMIRDQDCRGEIDLDALAQLLTDYGARIAALEIELEQARARKEAA